MATNHDTLRGSCTCGRNNYAILLPSSEEAAIHQEFEIFFDDQTENAYLRVPISRYQSFTTAFFPDETHSSIRRTYTPLHAPTSQQIFCGHCGTQLSNWSESPPTESQHLNISLSTMKGRDLERLEDLGVLRPEVDDAVDTAFDTAAPGSTAPTERAPTGDSTITRGESGGMSWIQAARRSGGLSTRKGMGRSRDGKMVVEWEVSEYTEDGDGGAGGGRGKRKLEEREGRE